MKGAPSRDDGPARPRTIARGIGRSGELALRRHDAHLEIVCNGAFLVSTENETSSRALVEAARPLLPGRRLDVLIGGLGVGHALDEALALPGLRSVTVVELEPLVVEWFRDHGGEPAARALGDPRVEVVVEDVGETMSAARGRYDLLALDTDNGPGWLVREENARLYDDDGVAAAAATLRAGGVAAFWAAERHAVFEERFKAQFRDVRVTRAVDVIGRHRNVAFIYLGRRW